jgi:putative ABC transport system permease protein
MLKNWITLSARRFIRNRVNSILNIFGLSLGLFVFLIIFIYVKYEFSYDDFHTDSDHVFRLIKETASGDGNYQGVNKYAVLPAPLADVLKSDVTGVNAVARIVPYHQGTIVSETEGKTFYDDSYFAADGEIFNILTFELVAGNRSDALLKPNTVAISETIAIKYFGKSDVVGNTIEFTTSKKLGAFTVDLVFKDIPSNSSYRFNIIIRFEDYVKAIQPTDLENWSNSNYSFLVRTEPGTDPTTVETQIKNYFINKFQNSEITQASKNEYLLEPIRDIYLNPSVNFAGTPTNDINRLYMLVTIACFVLMVAGINYVNLTTAGALSRAKEVGIRKVSGAFKSNLVLQFLSDAIVISLVSLTIALLSVWIVFPWFCDFIGKPIPFKLWSDPLLLMIIFGIPAILGLLAGTYPALVLSSFNPIQVLKGSFSRSKDGSMLRDLLTIVQFSISGILVIAIIIIRQQLHFIENNDPGYEKENILSVNLKDEGVRDKIDFFVQELKKHPNIVSTSMASYLPNNVGTQQSRNWNGPEGQVAVSFYTIHADHNYVDLFNLQIIKGRNFSNEIKSDKNAILINETAAKTYGWDDPVGMEFTNESGGSGTGDTVRIIGVIKDIHIASYRRPIEPFRICAAKGRSRQLAVKINSNNRAETLSYIESTYKNLATTKLPYTFSFFDVQYNSMYKTEHQLGKLISIFSVISILIASLGLYGLSMHSVTQRLKEIGVRKILGAKIEQLTFMLSIKFASLVLFAFIIAAPAAYYIMNQWLAGFVYHAEIGVDTFLITIFVMITVSMVTVGSQTWRAACTNPTDVLRNE